MLVVPALLTLAFRTGRKRRLISLPYPGEECWVGNASSARRDCSKFTRTSLVPLSTHGPQYHQIAH